MHTKILNATRKRNSKKSKLNIDNQVDDKPLDHITESIKTSNKLWIDIKKRLKEDITFINKSDDEKITIYQNTEYKNFYTEYPIVCRYMICMGQFSNKAFNKFLLKCKNVVHDPVKSREPGYNDDQWICRQSDYVKYLWESYQKQHYSKSDANTIWMQTYKTLKKEFLDFKNLHKEIEEKLKLDKQTNKTELVKEMLERLSKKEQTLDSESSNILMDNLRNKVMEQRKKKLIKSIETEVKKINP